MCNSGSDGNLLFVREGTKSVIPYKERYAPQQWRTSNGTFKTTNVGKLKLLFPEFSSSKVANIKADILTVPETDAAPIYDLIIVIESLTKLGAILNFADKSITIDHVVGGTYLNIKKIKNLRIGPFFCDIYIY